VVPVNVNVLNLKILHHPLLPWEKTDLCMKTTLLYFIMYKLNTPDSN